MPYSASYLHTYITLHYIALHYITLHYIALHCIALHYITLHYITLHCIALHCIALHYITYITLRRPVLGSYFVVCSKCATFLHIAFGHLFDFRKLLMDFDEIWYWLSAVTFLSRVYFRFVWDCFTVVSLSRDPCNALRLFPGINRVHVMRILFFLLKTERNLQFFLSEQKKLRFAHV